MSIKVYDFWTFRTVLFSIHIHLSIFDAKVWALPMLKSLSISLLCVLLENVLQNINLFILSVVEVLDGGSGGLTVLFNWNMASIAFRKDKRKLLKESILTFLPLILKWNLLLIFSYSFASYALAAVTIRYTNSCLKEFPNDMKLQ